MECKFCGKPQTNIKEIVIKEFETKEEIIVYKIEFECGSFYEYSLRNGKIDRFLWEDSCSKIFDFH